MPNALRDEIDAQLDAAIAECPEAAIEREALYEQLLAYYDEHGFVPEFSITKKDGDK